LHIFNLVFGRSSSPSESVLLKEATTFKRASLLSLSIEAQGNKFFVFHAFSFHFITLSLSISAFIFVIASLRDLRRFQVRYNLHVTFDFKFDLDSISISISSHCIICPNSVLIFPALTQRCQVTALTMLQPQPEYDARISK